MAFERECRSMITGSFFGFHQGNEVGYVWAIDQLVLPLFSSILWMETELSQEIVGLDSAPASGGGGGGIPQL